MTVSWGPGGLVASGLAAPGPQGRAAPAPSTAVGDLFAARPSWKALSLWQPWASLIGRGMTGIITVARATDYRGPLAIHAAGTFDHAGAPDDLCRAALGVTWRSTLPAGAIVAIGELVDVQPARQLVDRLTRAERAAGVFSESRLAWRLADVRALRRPIPYPGRQGLFNWTPPEDLHDRLGSVLDPAALAHAIGWGRQPAEAT